MLSSVTKLPAAFVVLFCFWSQGKASLLARGLNCGFPFEAVNKVLNQLLCRSAAPEFRMKREDVKMGRWSLRRATGLRTEERDWLHREYESADRRFSLSETSASSSGPWRCVYSFQDTLPWSQVAV